LTISVKFISSSIITMTPFRPKYWVKDGLTLWAHLTICINIDSKHTGDIKCSTDALTGIQI
jgi:hypothetical protein